MTANDISIAVEQWTNWASQSPDGRYDVALFKIWIQFEKFLAELFIKYATGIPSETGFTPNLKLRFIDETQLNAFLREGNRTYIEYLSRIENLSKHIFDNNPFDVLFLDANYHDMYIQVSSVRNYIAHESGEARAKMIKTCFGGREDRFMEPNVFLLSRKKNTKVTRYTVYTNAIKDVAQLLVAPPQ